jgi:FAD/FMN-containing dehydrogenase
MIVKELAKIVGNDHVLIDSSVLNEYSHDLSFAPPMLPEAVVQPSNTDELQAVIKLANRTLTPLVPVSSGPPHFRGDTVPVVAKSVIVDLRRLNRVLKIDEHYKTAIVEPGVTFGTLKAALNKVGLSPFMPLAPRASKSVIGSVLEREPVTVPSQHWDSCDPMLCVEIVFGTGDKSRTGEAAGPDPLEKQWEIGKAQMSPFGPTQMDLQRLVSGAQGTIGIVSWMSLKCRFLTSVNRPFLVASPTLEPLINLSQKLVKPRLGEQLFILNRLNLAVLLGRGAGEIQQFYRLLPPWVMFVNFEGFGPLPEDKVRYQEADLIDLARPEGLTPAANIQSIQAETILEAVSQPSDQEYWKLRLKGGFQDLFFLTTLDKTPGFVTGLTGLAKTSGYTWENVGVYIQPIVQGTSCHCEFDLYYDPAEPADITKTREFLRAAPPKIENLGGFFSRPYSAWAETAYSRAEDTALMQINIKKIFDPEGILNPGKLCF